MRPTAGLLPSAAVQGQRLPVAQEKGGGPLGETSSQKVAHVGHTINLSQPARWDLASESSLLPSHYADRANHDDPERTTD